MKGDVYVEVRHRRDNANGSRVAEPALNADAKARYRFGTAIGSTVSESSITEPAVNGSLYLEAGHRLGTVNGSGITERTTGIPAAVGTADLRAAVGTTDIRALDGSAQEGR